MLFALFLLVLFGIAVVLFRQVNLKKASQSPAQPQPQRIPAAPVPEPEKPAATVPESLPLKAKQWLFSRSEAAFFDTLEAALPPGYRAFPNIRLNDLFLITTKENGVKQATLGRLRDKHVDFLIVSLPEHRPLLGIELDGQSHDNSRQQYRDAVKDVAFRSGGLTLVRLRAEQAHSVDSVRQMLLENGIGIPVQAVKQTVA